MSVYIYLNIIWRLLEPLEDTNVTGWQSALVWTVRQSVTFGLSKRQELSYLHSKRWTDCYLKIDKGKLNHIRPMWYHIAPDICIEPCTRLSDKLLCWKSNQIRNCNRTKKKEQLAVTMLFSKVSPRSEVGWRLPTYASSDPWFHDLVVNFAYRLYVKSKTEFSAKRLKEKGPMNHRKKEDDSIECVSRNAVNV